MYQISLFISGLLAHMFTSPRTVRVVEYQTQLDPRGLVAADIAYIRRNYRVGLRWKEGTTLEELAYQQGRADTIDFIENKVIGRRLDG
jgi:hypothetical protein